jgi:hypothetical protein
VSAMPVKKAGDRHPDFVAIRWALADHVRAYFRIKFGSDKVRTTLRGDDIITQRYNRRFVESHLHGVVVSVSPDGSGLLRVLIGGLGVRRVDLADPDSIEQLDALLGQWKPRRSFGRCRRRAGC